MSQSDGPDEAAPEPDEAPAQPASTSPATGRPTALLITIAAVVVLAVAGVVVFFVTGDDSDDTAARPVPTIEGSDPPTSTIPSSQPAGATPPPPSSATSAAAPATGEAGEAQSVAEQVATAISNADMATLTELSCDPSTAGDEDTFPADATAEVVGEPVIEGDTATIDVRLTIAGAEPTVVPMPLTKQGDRWCIP